MDAPGAGRPAAGVERPEGREHDAEQETCIIFDWDDTILPTSWLERIHALACGGPLRPEVQRQMAALTTIASQTLTLAASMGVVVIITNSAPGWVDQSCQLFMPQILQQVRGLQIFAKPMHAPLTFKISTFRRECRQYRNVISVGDGDAERAASLRLQAPPDRRAGGGTAGEQPDPARRIKSVKLLELPTCQQLIVQHEMLQVRLADVAAFQGNLDLKARLNGNGISSPGLNGRDTCCSLVHFARPQPGPANATSSLARGLPDDSAKMQGLMSLRSVPPSVRSGAGGGQLPPLGRSGSHCEPEGSPGGVVASAGGGGTSGVSAPSAEPGSTTRQGEQAAATPAEEDGARDSPVRLGGASPGRGSAEGGGLWKVHDAGGKAARAQLYHGAGKRKPMRTGVGIGPHSGGAVWREHSAPAATRSF